MKAAVFHGPHQPLTIENVDIDKPIGREVLVRTVASGVCHSDLHFVDGFYPFPTPAILGHEAAGIVEAVGLQVSEFKPSDHVIACLSLFCGPVRVLPHRQDPPLPDSPHPLQARAPEALVERPARNQFANLSAYAEQMLVHENALVKIDDEMPLDRAALIGCGVTTGVGEPGRNSGGAEVCSRKPNAAKQPIENEVDVERDGPQRGSRPGGPRRTRTGLLRPSQARALRRRSRE
jgi:S-(hydroxymethyl)glutathione dehydrogenase/alcohol dehydrogenase